MNIYDRQEQDIAELKSEVTELQRIAKPDTGWRPEDFTTDTAETIRDKRNLIDIITKYASRQENFEEFQKIHQKTYDSLKELLEEYKIESGERARQANIYQELKDWWDQNQTIIESAQEAQDVRAQSSAILEKVVREKGLIEQVQRALLTQIATNKREIETLATTATTAINQAVEEARRLKDQAGSAATNAVNTRVNQLVDGAPAALDTLREIAAELEKHTDALRALTQTVGQKADAATMNTELGRKLNLSEVAMNPDGNRIVRRKPNGTIPLPANPGAEPNSAVSKQWVENYHQNTDPKAHHHTPNDITGLPSTIVTVMQHYQWEGIAGDYVKIDQNLNVTAPKLFTSKTYGDVAFARDLTARTGAEGTTSITGSIGYKNRTIVTDANGRIHNNSAPTLPSELVNKRYVDATTPWVGTDAEYKALTDKDPNRLYIIR
ncbi:hypothetical protein [Corynebacterium matruchotii]